MGIFCLTVGMRGILTKRPFMISNRWFLATILVVLIPSILLTVLPLFRSDAGPIKWLNALVCGSILMVIPASVVVFIEGLCHLRGYRRVVSGSTNRSCLKNYSYPTKKAFLQYGLHLLKQICKYLFSRGWEPVLSRSNNAHTVLTWKRLSMQWTNTSACPLYLSTWPPVFSRWLRAYLMFFLQLLCFSLGDISWP